jgi:hypothetical protein
VSILVERLGIAYRQSTSEHYFEMSHVDAEQALVIYRHFCKQAEYAVEYLGVGKKLQNLLNVPIPSLKHVNVPNFTHVESR